MGKSLLDVDIEELMKIDVTSVRGVNQEWFKTPAAMYVITNEDIRRTGHRTLAEALRLAPGVFVGQSTSSTWVVGMRGFSSGLANKTLVLIDGRTVYDPLFNGTFWDVQDVFLEDIDRIEVIRGPGPTLWGSNAVNGVINVITRSAKDTQGLYISGGGGTYERGFAEVRYGGQINDHAWYRVWGKYANRDDFEFPNGNSANDSWDLAHGGFRMDFEGDDITYTLQGDAYNVNEDSLLGMVPEDLWANGANLLFNMLKQGLDGDGWRLLAYYDRTNRRGTNNASAFRNSGNIDWRQWWKLGDRHELMWGAEYFVTADRVENGPSFVADPASRTLNTFSAFIQDTITLVRDRWFVMVGSKFEHNDYTGFEVQPSGRIWWTPDESNTLWAAISRPVRVPSRTERDTTIGVLPVAVLPNPNAESEQLNAYEIGYRHKFGKTFTLDLAAFYNDYPKLLLIRQFPPLPTTWSNEGSGESYGTEITATWQVAKNWRLESSYTYTNVEIHGPVFPGFDEGGYPEHQFKAASFLDITDNLEFNSALYYADVLPSPMAPSYIRLDVGVTWRPKPNVEIALWGLNVLDPHRETGAAEVPRSAYLQLSVTF